MARHVVASVGLLLCLVLAVLACSAPQPQPPDSPAGRATEVRRTAVAEVQAIIANKSTSTPPPAPTATPKPTCPNAIWWTEARTHTGETHTIQGTVIASRPGVGGAILVEMGQPYPDPTGLAILVTSGAVSNLSGKTVCVGGRIGLVEGRPTLQVTDQTAFTVLD